MPIGTDILEDGIIQQIISITVHLQMDLCPDLLLVSAIGSSQVHMLAQRSLAKRMSGI
jgi:hypothetical protein